MRRKVSAALISFGLAVTLLAGCGSISSDSEPTMSKKVKVEAQEASIGTLEIISTYIANIDPINSVSVTPLVSGVVKSLKVKVGDKVKRGRFSVNLMIKERPLQCKMLRMLWPVHVQARRLPRASRLLPPPRVMPASQPPERL